MIIKSFNINTSDIPVSGGFKNFVIDGDNGAKFRLFAQYSLSGVIYYYNFTKSVWQITPTHLDATILDATGYEGSFSFPAQSAARQIDIFLLADAISNTVHAPYVEVLDVDGNIDINASSGSNSLMLTKRINQIVAGTIQLRPISKSTAAGFVSAELTSKSFTASVGSNISAIPFTITATAAVGSVLKIDRAPTEEDFYVLSARTINDPLKIQGEDLFDAGQTARSTGKTVDGAVNNSTSVTMDDDRGSFWAVGDRVTGNAQLDALTDDNAVTITAVDVGSNAKVFTLSQAVTISDGETLDFTEPYYYRWEVSSVQNLVKGMTLFDTAANPDAIIAPYKNIPALTAANQTVVTYGGSKIPDASYVRALTTVGEVVFNKAQPLALKDQNVDFLAYGRSMVNALSAWNVEITDLKAEITKPITTTTAAVVNNTLVPVALGHGIMDDVSTVSSVNMDSSVADPTVTNIASYSSNTATLTLSSAQTLENGETLTFDKAARIITITGNIKINDSLGSEILYLDLDRFITGVTIF